MTEELSILIRNKRYPYPGSSRLGDAALIEQLTGLTHAEWRRRYRQTLEDALDGEVNEADEDSAVSVGIIAQAVARQNPRWSRSRIVDFVNDIDWEDVEFVGGANGDVGPPASNEGDNSTASPTGSESVLPSRSGSEPSSESTTPPTSGTPTSDTSPELSDPET